jgi:hypothetical protein
LGERRRLCARAATAPVLARVGGADADEAIGHCESAISAARCRFGDVGVAEAVAKLKAIGRVDLARRLRTASSRRNKQGHPDPGLACEIHSLVFGEVVADGLGLRCC